MLLSRRRLLAAALSLPLLPRRAAATTAAANFPAGFLWGASTSAAQIEGAASEDGRGPSIWDAFARQPGKIADGGTPAVACDHYHRWREDIALMRRLGLTAYRFSISWSRVIPAGTGAANAKGWDFYDRLVDGLLATGITPMPCLFHWDLPLALHERGGWMSRDSAGWFADYAVAAARRLGDRVPYWLMLNEPSVMAIFGYGLAAHAPGLGGGAPACLAALHHQNLAQGTALKALRAERPAAKLGTVLSLQPVVADSARAADGAAAIRWDAVWNRVALDGVMRGAIPGILVPEMAKLVRPDDLAIIRQPLDLLGVNYYSKMTVRAQPGALFDTGWGRPRAARFTAMGWPVQPEGLLDILMELKALYGNPPVMITENGAAYDDRLGPDGEVADPTRIAFLGDHLRALRRALAAGCNVRGYLVWSLMDNFEWQAGYTRRFGLAYVDYASERRIPKASFHWYGAVMRGERPI
ncbi:MAG TPA: GH1 family beta-glucosidase [Alphaproteobacteria bacterium]|nr:GH1 family beta-glucosidase [Alphaproteobacteria bacterium]